MELKEIPGIFCHVTLTCPIIVLGGKGSVIISYYANDQVLDPSSVRRYLERLSEEGEVSVYALANRVSEDLQKLFGDRRAAVAVEVESADGFRLEVES